MHQTIEKVLEKLYPQDDGKYSIKECAHNKYLTPEYDVFEEFEFENWMRNNPDIIEGLRTQYGLDKED